MNEELEIRKEEIAPEAWRERTKPQREFILEKLNELEKPPKEIKSLLKMGNEIFSADISSFEVFLKKAYKEKDQWFKEEIKITKDECEKKIAKHLKGGWGYFSMSIITSKNTRSPEDVYKRLEELEKLIKEGKIETIYA